MERFEKPAPLGAEHGSRVGAFLLLLTNIEYVHISKRVSVYDMNVEKKGVFFYRIH